MDLHKLFNNASSPTAYIRPDKQNPRQSPCFSSVEANMLPSFSTLAKSVDYATNDHRCRSVQAASCHRDATHVPVCDPFLPHHPDPSFSQEMRFPVDHQSANSIFRHQHYSIPNVYPGCFETNVQRFFTSLSAPSVNSYSSLYFPSPPAANHATNYNSIPNKNTFHNLTSHYYSFQSDLIGHTQKVWSHQQLVEFPPLVQKVSQPRDHKRASPPGIRAMHKNNNQYECKSCNRFFSRPSALNIHFRSHTGEKPFHCPKIGCNRAFSVLSNMRRHTSDCPKIAKH
ncbi:unnamed protein product [Penicillium salamii]|nr:unnamed protein product [Penicillium salamii]CAG7995227.1 unnamed protein product [Penicillium salamii]CAG8081864.1 unnamed protein product [Penicillium salamii]CAG8422394.1 unnamed protein product [Penicillium salamii]